MKSTAIKRSAASTTGLQRPNSLAEDVYDAIFAQLMSLTISPGSRITVDTLVRELNVSHTPIREALGRLEGEGLVLRAHLVGYSAAPQVSRDRFDELYELRLMLEPEAAAKAAVGLDDAGFTALQRLAGVMADDDDATDEQLRYSDFARQDADFHDKILELAGNGLVRDVLRMQHTHFHIFRLMYHRLVTVAALDEHEALLDALRRGDGQLARAAMRTHIQNSRTRLLPAFV